MVVIGKVFGTLIGIMLLDYLTGMISAIVNNELNSRIGARGIWKKVSYIIGIILAFAVDYLISQVTEYNTHYSCTYLIMTWYGINEILSILENLSEIGVPFPDFLIKRLAQFRDKINEGDVKNGNIETGVGIHQVSTSVQPSDKGKS